ncbi:sulfite exporter TauE/SafE family protein [Occallatibacter savannae]|uniref:sulfite exporter TauE/SafE family protein n=1 Tax=Occallatibacter savannae TaxID=1002691 RepID=UPI001EF4CA29|nr:sulfite exporter TauE/SafE family protein [Occallatibacter savannae]
MSGFAPASKSIPALSPIEANALLALLTWAAWLLFGGTSAVHHLIADWKIGFTMVFGSLVGGGTSEGGGAVAFPVFTKILTISAFDARNFSLAIQSVGMGAASVSILLLRIPIERRSVLYAGIPSIAGVIFGGVWIAPLVPAVFVRTSFTVLVTTIGFSLLLLNRENNEFRNARMPRFGRREVLVLVATGFLGGIVSSLVGTGANSVVSMVMVLLFRINEKIATPTSVVVMTMATIPGFLLHLFWLKDFSPTVEGYWLAAVPIVAVGGPLGALLCSRMSRRWIVNLLLALISLEFVSTIVLVPISRSVLLVSAATLLICGSLDWLMTRIKNYASETAESGAQD